jgi:sensor histidine kinase YesM
VIQSARDGDALVLRVRNESTSAGPAERAGGSGAGVGLRNTRARLEHLYGSRHRFSLVHSDSGETVAEARFPCRVERLA